MWNLLEFLKYTMAQLNIPLLHEEGGWWWSNVPCEMWKYSFFSALIHRREQTLLKSIFNFNKVKFPSMYTAQPWLSTEHKPMIVNTKGINNRFTNIFSWLYRQNSTGFKRLYLIIHCVPTIVHPFYNHENCYTLWTRYKCITHFSIHILSSSTEQKTIQNISNLGNTMWNI